MILALTEFRVWRDETLQQIIIKNLDDWRDRGSTSIVRLDLWPEEWEGVKKARGKSRSQRRLRGEITEAVRVKWWRNVESMIYGLKFFLKAMGNLGKVFSRKMTWSELLLKVALLASQSSKFSRARGRKTNEKATAVAQVKGDEVLWIWVAKKEKKTGYREMFQVEIMKLIGWNGR